MPPSQDPNVEFYRGAMPSRPHGALIDEIHTEWWGNFELLEMHHGYIQWLFPVFENAGMNWESSPLTKEGATSIRTDAAASARVLRSYELMLHFYGLVLADQHNGRIERDPDAKHAAARLGHLNTSPHNWLRVSRIITSLGELGFRRYKVPLVRFLGREVSSGGGLLKNARQSHDQFWVRLLDEETPWYSSKTLEVAADRAEGCLFAAGGSLAGEAAAATTDTADAEGDGGPATGEKRSRCDVA